MLKKFLSSVFIFFSLSLNANENLPLLAKKNHPDFQFSSQSEFKFLMWKIYDIYLFNNKYNENEMALKLKYNKDINKEKIIESSIKLIIRQNFTNQQKINSWQNKLAKIIPDIKKNQILIGVKSKDKTIFYNSKIKLGEINDPEFSKYFFNIWLGENTIEPNIRKDLLKINE